MDRKGGKAHVFIYLFLNVFIVILCVSNVFADTL